MANDVYKRCDFCGKSEMKVKNMFTAGQHSICDECVTYCYDILRDQGMTPSDLHIMPEEVKQPTVDLKKPAEIRLISRSSSGKILYII